MALLLSAPLAGQVVADEPGCLLYQLVMNGDGEYFVFELYKDQCAAAPCSAPLARRRGPRRGRPDPLAPAPTQGGARHAF